MLVPQATDADEEGTANSNVTYSIDSTSPAGVGSHFHLDPVSGRLNVTSALDYDVSSVPAKLCRDSEARCCCEGQRLYQSISIGYGGCHSHCESFTSENNSNNKQANKQTTLTTTSLESISHMRTCCRLDQLYITWNYSKQRTLTQGKQGDV